LIAVVMASPTRDARNNIAVKLLDHGFANYGFYADEAADLENVTIPVKGSVNTEITVRVPDSFRKLVEKNQKDKIERFVSIESELKAPIKQGTTVGNITYTMNGKEIGSMPIVANENADRIEFWDLLKIALKKLAIF